MHAQRVNVRTRNSRHEIEHQLPLMEPQDGMVTFKGFAEWWRNLSSEIIQVQRKSILESGNEHGEVSQVSLLHLAASLIR
eukprot:SAG11_NODE_3194_length_2620_cov_2.356208_3_plen_80_part_00